MTAMYDLVEACLLEAHDLRFRTTHSKLGSNIGGSTAFLRGKVSERSTAAGSTKQAAYIGDSARKLAAFISRLPIFTLTPDAIQHAYCVDLLREKLKRSPNDPTAAVQLAEALVAVQQTQSLIRMARMVDPLPFLMGTGLRMASTAGRQGQLAEPAKLARLAHRAVMTSGGPSKIEQQLALARAYRVAGKPGLATRYASLAGTEAAQALSSLGEPQTTSFFTRLSSAFRTGGIQAVADEFDDVGASVEKALDRWAASYSGEEADIDEYTRTRMQAGTAWTVIAWALRDLGDRQQARAAANMALATGFTTGNEVLAALVSAEQGGLMDRLSNRAGLLEKVTRADRTFYRGRWRGAAWITGSVLNEQVRKAGRLFD